MSLGRAGRSNGLRVAQLPPRTLSLLRLRRRRTTYADVATAEVREPMLSLVWSRRLWGIQAPVERRALPIFSVILPACTICRGCQTTLSSPVRKRIRRLLGRGNDDALSDLTYRILELGESFPPVPPKSPSRKERRAAEVEREVQERGLDDVSAEIVRLRAGVPTESVESMREWAFADETPTYSAPTTIPPRTCTMPHRVATRSTRSTRRVVRSRGSATRAGPSSRSSDDDPPHDDVVPSARPGGCVGVPGGLR